MAKTPRRKQSSSYKGYISAQNTKATLHSHGKAILSIKSTKKDCSSTFDRHRGVRDRARGTERERKRERRVRKRDLEEDGEASEGGGAGLAHRSGDPSGEEMRHRPDLRLVLQLLLLQLVVVRRVSPASAVDGGGAAVAGRDGPLSSALHHHPYPRLRLHLRLLLFLLLLLLLPKSARRSRKP